MKNILLFCFMGLEMLGYAQQAGDLDITFGDSGIVETDFENAKDEATCLSIQSDEKIIAAGYAYNVGSRNDFALARYNSNGSLDMTFGIGGKVMTSFGTSNDNIRSIVIDSLSGKIVVAGIANNHPDYVIAALARYNPDGSLDNSFGSGGLLTTSFDSGLFSLNSVTLQPDGKIVAAGHCEGTNNGGGFAIVRYNSDGTLDTTFGSNGKVVTSLVSTLDVANSVIVLSDGKILVAGGWNGGIYGSFLLAKYNPGGILDTLFGSAGKVITQIPGGMTSYANAMAIQTDGKIILTGRVGWDLEYNFALARYNLDGALDSSFNEDGTVVTHINEGFYSARSLVLQPDGKIIVAGGESLTLARYNQNGSLDSSFNTDGLLTTIIGDGSRADAVTLQPDGKIVIAGFVDSLDWNFVVARYQSGLYLDIVEHETENIITLYPNPATNQLTVESEWAFKNGQLEISNAQGQLVYTSPCPLLEQGGGDRRSGVVDISALAPGIYFLNLNDGEQVVNRKFIKE